jgi:hypothetical protein
MIGQRADKGVNGVVAGVSLDPHRGYSTTEVIAHTIHLPWALDREY